MLSYTHAGLYYVYHVVAELLALLDDVHIHRTDGIGIEVVVHIVDVLALQLVAVVVDFVLDVERAVHVEPVLASGEHDIHLGETVVGQFEHLLQVLILLLGEILLALELAAYSACNVVATVADTLQFGNLA